MTARRIFKYRLNHPFDTVTHDTDPDGEVVHVGPDPEGWACVWIAVNPAAPTGPRSFHITGTGHNIPEGGQPLGAFVDDLYVWHVIEVPAGAPGTPS